MDDTTILDQGQSAEPANGVVRRFSPVRIERLLLTRLFDLTTGQAILDVGEEMATAAALDVTVETTRLDGKEAA